MCTRPELDLLKSSVYTTVSTPVTSTGTPDCHARKNALGSWARAVEVNGLTTSASKTTTRRATRLTLKQNTGSPYSYSVGRFWPACRAIDNSAHETGTDRLCCSSHGHESRRIALAGITASSAMTMLRAFQMCRAVTEFVHAS